MDNKKLLGLCLGLGVLAVAVSCKTEVSYTVKFVDHDNTVLQELTLKKGETPNYTLSDPSRESTAQYTYTFTGWDKEVVEVTGDVTYTATYEETLNSYKVIFKDEDGAVLDTKTVDYGIVPTYTKAEPTKEANDQYTYRFNGWDKELSAVTGDVTYTAKYAQLTNAYKVTFIDLTGNTLYSADFEYGETPVYNGETPTLTGNDKYSYVFAGWTTPLAPVTEEATYRVKFDQVVNKYEVKFVDEEGAVLETKQVEYDTVPTFTGRLPSLPGDTAQYVYSGVWDKEFEVVKGAQIYTYKVKQEVAKHKVTFLNYDDSVLLQKEVEYGELPIYDLDTPVKPNTAQYGYTFTGWDKTLELVSGPAVYKAQYAEAIAKYQIKFVDGEGNELETKEVEYGEVPEFTGTLPDTTKTVKYSYIGEWDKEFEAVTEDATYTYNVTQSINEYEVTINHLNLDGSVAAPATKVTKTCNIEELYDGYYTYTAPIVEGKVPSHDYINYIVDGVNLTFNIYYSEVDTLESTTVASTSLSGEGNEASPYLISSAADFLYFKDNIATVGASGVYLKLTKSIDLNNINVRTTGEFAGTLDGNNCTIRGINISNATASETKTALFDTVSGTIKNLSVYGKVTNSGSGNGTSGLTGVLAKGTLTNISNYVDVTGAARMGGLVGSYTGGNVTDCINYGTIKGSSSRVGGLIGHSSNGNATNCKNFGSVSSTAGDVGGIWGYCQGSTQTIDGCMNFGAVSTESTSGTVHMGGIVAYGSLKKVLNCVNYGSVTSKGYSGAIVGRLNSGNDGALSNSSNYGTTVGRTSDLASKEGCEAFVNVVSYYKKTDVDVTKVIVNCYDYGD